MITDFLRQSHWFPKFVKYGVFGIVSTAIHVSLAFLYIWLVTPSFLGANLLAFTVAFIFSYSVQARFVFAVKFSWKNVFKYFVVQFCLLLLSMLLVSILEQESAYLKVLLTAFLLPLLAFIIHQFWTFSPQNHD